VGSYVIEAGLGDAFWRKADTIFAPIVAEHPTRKAAERELAARKPYADMRRIGLRVVCVKPDADEAVLEVQKNAPGAGVKPPLVVRLPATPRPAKAKAK
jgi:hypothetical protein